MTFQIPPTSGHPDPESAMVPGETPGPPSPPPTASETASPAPASPSPRELAIAQLRLEGVENPDERVVAARVAQSS